MWECIKAFADDTDCEKRLTIFYNFYNIRKQLLTIKCVNYKILVSFVQIKHMISYKVIINICTQFC